MLEALFALIALWLMAAVFVGVVSVIIIGVTRLALCARGLLQCGQRGR